MIIISKWGKASTERMLDSEEINKSNKAEMWESQSGNLVGKLTIRLSNRVHQNSLSAPPE